MDEPDSRNCSTLGKDVHQLAREDPIQRSCSSASTIPTPSHPHPCPLSQAHIFQWAGFGEVPFQQVAEETLPHTAASAENPGAGRTAKMLGGQNTASLLFFPFLFFFPPSQMLFHALMAIFKSNIGVTTYVSVGQAPTPRPGSVPKPDFTGVHREGFGSLFWWLLAT